MALSLLCLVTAASPPAAEADRAAASLTKLDFAQPGKARDVRAHAASADGSVIVGDFWDNATNRRQAFRWTAATGMVALGYMSVAARHVSSTATGVSADGRIVVGFGRNAADNYEAFRWTGPTGLVGLGFLSGTKGYSTATAISSDGNVVVGNSSIAAGGLETYRWTRATGMVRLGFIGGHDLPSIGEPLALNADGSVIVGRSGNAAGNYEAFRWTATTGVVGLGYLAGNHGPDDAAPFSEATGVSADGTVLVGTDTKPQGQGRAFRWTAASGMVGLGSIADGGATSASEAHGVSADGSIIVGKSTDDTDEPAPFRWTAATGMQSLPAILKDAGVWGGTRLDSAEAVSADGRVIVGEADTFNAAFAARVPRPSPFRPFGGWGAPPWR